MRFEIARYQSVTSTMDMARDMAERGVAEGVVIVADEQTAGRGRGCHTWYSPPDQSLYASLILRPTLSPAQAGWITMIAALAVRDGVGEQGSIKWFNDVMIAGRKVCGILVESSITGDVVDYAVLGIGLNVNTNFAGAPAEVRARATSLREAYGVPFDRELVLGQLLDRFAARYSELMRTRRSPAPEYAQFVDTLGRTVVVEAAGEAIHGRAERIDDDGALVVLSAAGERRIGFGTLISAK
jgi:BirA family transcriptional regulator, biotin operon repressor / biotin---[acetyl-CoA-carboxylase] ligase